jgi:predicted DNA binding CopG/RHH family protein
MSRKLEELNIDVKQFDADTELWESRKLGASAKHAKRSSKEHDKALDDAFGLRLCTFRIQKGLIEQLKRLAKLEGMGYQTFMRQILTHYVGENTHKLHELLTPNQATEIAEQSLMQALKYKKIIPTLKSMSNERISAECDYSMSLSEANALFYQAYKKCNDPVIKKHLKMRINQIVKLLDGEVDKTLHQKYKAG